MLNMSAILSPLFSSVALTLVWEYIVFNNFSLLNFKPSRHPYGVFYRCLLCLMSERCGECLFFAIFIAQSMRFVGFSYDEDLGALKKCFYALEILFFTILKIYVSVFL